MSNKKQSSVEWLIEQFNLQSYLPHIEQVKAMHKEEIMDAQMDIFNHLNDLPYGVDYLTKRDSSEQFSEQYYNETFNNK